MKAPLAVSAIAVALGSLPVTAASADPAIAPSPPFIDHTQWTQWQRLTSLRVYPTPAGRLASRQPGADAAGVEAWSEVVAKSQNADTPGMRAQFICHWEFAETLQPGKPSWNLEPWRPVVDDAEMVASGCNPGGQEEPF
jgi:hypothetical protein